LNLFEAANYKDVAPLALVQTLREIFSPAHPFADLISVG
jgi:hypothetical protein